MGVQHSHLTCRPGCVPARRVVLARVQTVDPGEEGRAPQDLTWRQWGPLIVWGQEAPARSPC